MSRVVLVTGVSRSLGARVADSLRSAPRVDRVVGLDSEAPSRSLEGVEHVRSELYDGSVQTALEESGADTVIHLGFAEDIGAPGLRRPKGGDPNLLGTMQLLAACQKSSSVRRLVVRSTAAVRDAVSAEYAGAAVEVERCVQGFARRRPDIGVAVLRFANLIGPSVDSPLTRYLALSAVPTVRGFDPFMHFLHEDDGVEVARRISLADCTGVFHAAAPGAMRLSTFLRRAGRPALPMRDRELKVLGGIARRGAKREYPPQRLRRLCYDGVLDTARLERELGWQPRYSSAEAFDAFIAGYAETAVRNPWPVGV